VVGEDLNVGTEVLNPSAELGGLASDTLKRRREHEDEDDIAGIVQEPETHGKKKRRRRKTELQATDVSS